LVDVPTATTAEIAKAALRPRRNDDEPTGLDRNLSALAYQIL